MRDVKRVQGIALVCAMAASWYGCQRNVAGTASNGPWPIIACFGDSLTAGFGLQPGESYPDDLQRDLTRRGLRYRVVNSGESGDTTADGLRRLPGVLALKPAIVVLEFGANDGIRGLPVAQMQANLERMIEALQESGAHVVLAGMTLPADFGVQYLRSFNGAFPRLVARYKLRSIPYFLAGVAGYPRYVQPDNLHPSAAGAERIAKMVYASVEPLLK
jgi:acyl-CoA thioesterase-1